MTEERLREFDWLTNVPDKENQVVIVAPNEIDELTAEIRRLRPVFEAADMLADSRRRQVEYVVWVKYCDQLEAAVDAAKAKEKRDD